MWPPIGLIPWFSKTEGNTYATLLHHPFLFKGKPTQCSRGSKKDFWRRCWGVYAQVKTYQVPITNPYPSHYIICHLPLAFLSPTSPLPFYSLFYQLLDSNLFTHRNTYAILREATSETYGPRVYFPSY